MRRPSLSALARLGLLVGGIPLMMGLRCVPSLPPSPGGQGGATGAGGAGGAHHTDGGVDASAGHGQTATDGSVDSRAAPDARVDRPTATDGRSTDGSTSSAACAAASPTDVWTTTTAGGSVGSLSAIGPGDIFSSGGQLNHWDGSSWSAFSPQPPFPGEVVAAADNDVWIQQFGSSSEFPVAHWDGAAWTDITPPFPAGTLWEPLWASGNSEGWVSAEVPLPLTPGGVQNQQGGIYHWAGSTWVKVPSPLDLVINQVVGSFWSSSPHDVWAVYSGGVIRWNGTAWASMSSIPLASGESPSSIWGSSARDVWLGVTGGAMSRMLHFDGSAWIAFTLPTAGIVETIWGSCPTDFWAITSTRGFGVTTLWRFDGTAWSSGSLAGSPQLFTVIAGTGPDDVWLLSDATAGTAFHWTPNRCGDGTIGPGEQCDPPHVGPDGLQCDSTCHLLTCGNGVIDPGEECDPPKSTGTVGLCTQTCQIPTCGDGVIEVGETCEPPGTTVCDSKCQSIPIVCGNGLVQPGETCDFPNGPYCSSCQITTCGQCFFGVVGATSFADTDVVCQALSGSNLTNCQALLDCMSAGLGACIHSQLQTAPQTACYCSDTTCSAGINGRCVNQINAVAGTADEGTVLGQLNDFTSLLSQVRTEATKFSNSSCGPPCAGAM
jgi:hypothetical protein